MSMRAAVVAMILLLSVCVNAGSQSRYTSDAAHGLVRAQDWNGLAGAACHRAEPISGETQT